jgi:hypothetical protein
LTWLESTLLQERLLERSVVLLTVVGAVMLLWSVRARMKAGRA